MVEAKIENPKFRISIFQEGNFIHIEIEDNGPGIKENIIKHVFDPFFTTKEVGSGTGLGLSISYFIIKEQHKGEMLVESKEGEGTKFIIRLPMGSGLPT
jgi:signal transduction histidine kinase